MGKTLKLHQNPKDFKDMERSVKELERSTKILSHSARAKSVEGAIVEAMDVLEAGIIKLEARVANLEGQGDLPTVAITTANKEPERGTVPLNTLKTSPKDRKEIVSIKPTIFGITIDVNEIWRRLKGWSDR